MPALLLALSLAAGPTAPTAPVTLRLELPDGVEGTRHVEGTTAGPMMGNEVRQDSTLRVRRAPDGWRVELGQPGNAAAPALTLVAGPDGAFRRFDGVEPFTAAALAALRKDEGLAGLVPGMHEAQQKVVDALLDAERAAWEEDVARWAGKELLPGATFEEARPAADARSLPTTVRYGLRRRVPCPGEGPEPRCVELTWVEETDEAARRRACAGPDSHAAAGLEATRAEWVLVTDPSTLLPRRSTATSRTENACEHGHLLGDITSTTERRYTWRPR